MCLPVMRLFLSNKDICYTNIFCRLCNVLCQKTARISCTLKFCDSECYWFTFEHWHTEFNYILHLDINLKNNAIKYNLTPCFFCETFLMLDTKVFVSIQYIVLYFEEWLVLLDLPEKKSYRTMIFVRGSAICTRN